MFLSKLIKLYNYIIYIQIFFDQLIYHQPIYLFYQHLTAMFSIWLIYQLLLQLYQGLQLLGNRFGKDLLIIFICKILLNHISFTYWAFEKNHNYFLTISKMFYCYLYPSNCSQLQDHLRFFFWKMHSTAFTCKSSRTYIYRTIFLISLKKEIIIITF